MNKTLASWLAATAMLLSLNNCASAEDCSLNKQPPITGGEPALFVRVVDNPTTRNSAPIPPGTPLVLNEGNIYLVNADGIIVEHFTIVNADGAITILTPENLAAGTIHRNLLDNGVVLPGVASNVSEVVIIGNTPNTTHTGNVNGEFIGGRLLNIISQHDAQNLNLFGRRALPATVNAEGNYVVEVHLAPTVARFELPSITGRGMIADFIVDGVFINNYHQNATVSGTIPGINSAPNLREYTDAAAFAYNAPNTNYTTASNNALFYWHATANAGVGFFRHNLTVRPSIEQTAVLHPNIGGGMYVMRDHVWGFQVFAQNYGETTNPETEAPRFVIRLSNIRLTDGRVITEPRFVTVGSFYRLESGIRVPVTHIRAADVYHIVTGIVFDETDLSDVPNVNEMAVEVTVTLAVWGGGDVHQEGPLRQPDPAAALIHSGTTHTFNPGAATGGSGTVTYQWQSSIDGTAWTDISGATNQNYTTGVLTADTYFRRRATDSKSTITSGGALVRVTTGAVISGLSIGWATRNVDTPNTFAANPQAAGRLYQWGTLNGATHHWVATGITVSGWNSSDDRVAWTAANQPCPAGWRVPTKTEFEALDNTGSTWHDNWNGTGQAGRVFPAGATAAQVTAAVPTAIFLSAVGIRASNGLLDGADTHGFYWSNTADDTTYYAWLLSLNRNSSDGVGILYRHFGLPIRCVQ